MKKLLYYAVVLALLCTACGAAASGAEADRSMIIGPVEAHAPAVLVERTNRNELHEAFEGAAWKFQISLLGLIAVAACESGFDPKAKNAAGPEGILQHDPRYWPGRVRDYNALFDPDVSGIITDVPAQTYITAWMIGKGELYAWSCGYCYYFENATGCKPELRKEVFRM